MLPQMPRELRGAIFSYLESRNIKNLRATCLALKEVIHLHIDRVFLSANHLNIEVFRAIADHDTSRRGVTEIVWDDARLSRGPELEEEHSTTLTTTPTTLWQRTHALSGSKRAAKKPGVRNMAASHPTRPWGWRSRGLTTKRSCKPRTRF